MTQSKRPLKPETEKIKTHEMYIEYYDSLLNDLGTYSNLSEFYLKCSDNSFQRKLEEEVEHLNNHGIKPFTYTEELIFKDLRQVATKIICGDSLSTIEQLGFKRFVKNPSRGRVGEKAQILGINENKQGFIFEKLDDNTKQSIYLDKNTGQLYTNCNKTDSMTKSIDGKLTAPFIKNHTILVNLKSTTEGGGGQNNQDTDAASFNLAILNNVDTNIVLVTIVEGEYWTTSRLNALKVHQKSGKSYVCHMKEKDICFANIKSDLGV